MEFVVRCRCGALEMVAADVSPGVANRVICHCAGCRAFAGRMDPSLLDERGGTERFQVTPASLTLRTGELHCVQQSPKGALRWFASCCATPLGLTLTTHRVPFVGLDVKRIAELRVPVADAIGPLRARVNGRFDRGERKALKADLRSLISMLRHLTPLTIRWWLRGDHKRSPFFERASGAPIVAVEKLYDTSLEIASGCR